MKVLLTGAAGFIGSHVAESVAAAGHDLVGLDNYLPIAHGRQPPVAHRNRHQEGLVIHRVDVRDRAAVAGLLEDVDVVCHQAAMVGNGVDAADLPEYVTHNDFGTSVLLAAMHAVGVSRLVLASSMVVYGEGAYTCPEHGFTEPAARTRADLDNGIFEPHCRHCARSLSWATVTEEAAIAPRSIYAATKVAQEHLGHTWAIQTGGRVLALRYHNVYGPRMPRDTPYAGVAAIFRSALERGNAPAVFEDGGQTRDFVHVDDIAAANMTAIHAIDDVVTEGGLRAYNVCSGQPLTIAEMAGILSRATNGPAPTITGEYRAADVRHVVASPERARRELGFAAAVAPQKGIADFAHAPLRH
ncbi:MAG: NAD-dependent epimerase/dehydratase family protein [Actinomycetota bacterium]|nr:NAD-dependent epimerase/dehydratase family protein [Actinomycetota bacterium]